MATALSCSPPPLHFAGAYVREQSACPGLQNGWPSPFIQRKISIRRIPGAKFCYHHHIHRALSHPFLEKGQPTTPLYCSWNGIDRHTAIDPWLQPTPANDSGIVCDPKHSPKQLFLSKNSFLFFLLVLSYHSSAYFHPFFPHFFLNKEKKLQDSYTRKDNETQECKI